MREELIAGLKNALDRGASLEDAVQSFINAGYSPLEVKQAANSLSGGVTSIMGASEQEYPKPLNRPPIQQPIQQNIFPREQNITQTRQNVQQPPQQNMQQPQQNVQNYQRPQPAQQVRPIVQQQKEQNYVEQNMQQLPQQNFQRPIQQMASPPFQQPRTMDYSPGPKRLGEVKSIQQNPRTNRGMIIFLVILLILLIGGLIFMVFKGPELLDTLLESSP